LKSANGYSLLELVVGLVLTALVGSAATALLHTQATLSRVASHQAATAEVVRTAAHVLAAETRWSDPLRDLRALNADSLALRAFRASAIVIRSQPDGRLLIRLNGSRAPDPAKDSVLVLRGAAEEQRARLLEAAPSSLPCGRGGDCYLFQLSNGAQAGDLLLVFESGIYYLTARALRYRLGAEGRQPITPELFDDARTFFDLGAGSSAAWLSTPVRPGSTGWLHVRLPWLNQADWQ
jgi:hypothetical protein